MKQIFDWLREQMQSKANLYRECPSEACWIRTIKDCDKCDLKSLEVREIFDVINEAEAKCSDIEQDAYQRGYVLGFDNGYKDGQFFEKAKWEAECCEYEYHVAPSKDIYFLTRCNHRHNGKLSGDRPYCGFCGKPIKIREVE